MDEALAAFDAKAYEEEWRTDGHALIGSRVVRSFTKRRVHATITRWLPPGANPREDPALFRVVHDDGDEEDLEEAEAEAAAAAASSATPRRTSARFRRG